MMTCQDYKVLIKPIVRHAGSIGVHTEQPRLDHGLPKQALRNSPDLAQKEAQSPYFR
jgi:hypothetical protein